jgi:hypothetical protein
MCIFPKRSCANLGRTSPDPKQTIGFIKQRKADPNEAFANPIQAIWLANQANGFTRQAFVNPIEASVNPNAPMACPNWTGLKPDEPLERSAGYFRGDFAKPEDFFVYLNLFGSRFPRV